MTFKEAVEKTLQLKGSCMAGLRALRAQDRRHIEAEDTRKLAGSVDVDTAYQKLDPQANRWDFGIGYRHANREEDVIYWVETHTASTSEVNVVIKKALWLLAWFKGDGKLLAEFEKDIIWVSSGATTFTLSAPRKKQMAQAGLKQSGGRLRIRNQRKS
jgi:hypothetical protein